MIYHALYAVPQVRQEIAAHIIPAVLPAEGEVVPPTDGPGQQTCDL